MAIPVVDLADFYQEIQKRNQILVQALGNAYEDVGFVAVKNHGISRCFKIADSINCAAIFFLCRGTKKKYEKAELAGAARIYFFRQRTCESSDAPDLKEFFQFGTNGNDNDPIKSEYPLIFLLLKYLPLHLFFL